MCALQILEKINDELISAPNEDGKTCLHIAAKNGLSDVVSSLVDRGANFLAEDKQGFWPALACAPNNEVAECLRILILAMLPSSDASTLSSTMARTSIVSPLDQGDEMHVDE